MNLAFSGTDCSLVRSPCVLADCFDQGGEKQRDTGKLIVEFHGMFSFSATLGASMVPCHAVMRRLMHQYGRVCAPLHTAAARCASSAEAGATTCVRAATSANAIAPKPYCQPARAFLVPPSQSPDAVQRQQRVAPRQQSCKPTPVGVYLMERDARNPATSTKRASSGDVDDARAAFSKLPAKEKARLHQQAKRMRQGMHRRRSNVPVPSVPASTADF